MNKIKLILTMALTFVVLFAQVGNVAAAPLAQDPTITGIVTDIVLETDANGVTTVLVTLDNLGTTQTVRISVDTAFGLGLLVTLDPPVVDTTKINTDTSVTIDPATVILDEPPVEESVHPIATLLAAFFGAEDENLASVIDDYHEEGFGFGVIAQALWMSQNLTTTEDEAGDASLAEAILDAKENHDYSFFADYFEDGTVPTNWGQFRKALLNKKQNLGVVVSGQADLTEQESSNSNGNGHGNGNRNNNGNGKGPGNNNGQNKNK